MSELSDLAEALTRDLPVSARKVIDKALEHGWELNRPGMTVALRLNHPTDPVAAPVYVTWLVKRTPQGKVGFTFDSCSAATLTPLRPGDLLAYLEDPTVGYTVAEEAQAAMEARLASPQWDKRRTPEENLQRMLGGSVVAVEAEREPGGKGRKRETFNDIMARQRQKLGVPLSEPVASKEGTVAREGFHPPATPSQPSAGSRQLRVRLPSRTSGGS